MIEKKSKEPKLSEYMEGLIYRNQGTISNHALDYNILYKQRVANVLSKDEDMLRCLHTNEFISTKNELNGEVYLNKYLFTYLRLPDNKSSVKNYVCIETEENHGYNYDDKEIINMMVTIRCVVHKDDMKTDWGVNRADLMASIVKKDFDWSHAAGGLEFQKQQEYSGLANNEYYYRDIVYLIKVPNDEYYRLNADVKGNEFRTKPDVNRD